MRVRHLPIIAIAAAGLTACGPPPGFTGDPPGVNYNDILHGCVYRSWAYKEPQNRAVYIDCLADAGYIPNPETVRQREELRKQGY